MSVNQIFNVYCDESCHLEHDRQPVMLLGAVWCPYSEVRHHTTAIRAIKEKHHARGELKWVKASPSREGFFLDIIEYFFSAQNLNFRCLVVDQKEKLDHSFFNKGSHDSFYYKMYFYLLRNIISPPDQYNVYLDIKDTRSQTRILSLRDVICNNLHDFERQVVRNIQHVRSKEVDLLQLADLFTGAVSYKARSLSSSKTKAAIVERICQLSGRSMRNSTPPWEIKFNLFFFSPREAC